MNQEQKQCQNCKQNFTIESDDFAFYDKIKVPPPTFCPQCRMIRRMCFRNERTLYHDTCKATGKKIISMFDPKKGLTVFERGHWWSDQWEPTDYGIEYDFSRPFFEQWNELLHKVPLANLGNTNVVQSDYVNHTADSKNCYLTYATWKAENVFYSQGALETRDSYDTYTLLKSDSCYESLICSGLYQTHFSYDSDDSLNSYFLSNCIDCQDCIGCVNLRHQKYHIFNTPYSKEEYKEKLASFNFGSYASLEKFKNEFKLFTLEHPHKFASILKSVDVTGDYIASSKNSKEIFDVYGEVENSKYAVHVVGMRDSYDGYGFGANSELLYEGVDSGINAARQYFATLTHSSFDTQYTYMCYNSKHLFGCIGLRGKSYCIFNTQYTKEEYENLVPKIIEQMKQIPYVDMKGNKYFYGEFFPVEISPFAYNETIAQEYFPLNKNTAIDRGYIWNEVGHISYQITLESENIPDHIRDVSESITKEIIGCQNKGKEETKCTTAFKILPDELAFYKRLGFPIPRLCPNCRHFERLSKRRPLKLWHRQCMCQESNHEHQGVCPNEFETSYAPERPEKIYCERCYQQEVV